MKKLALALVATYLLFWNLGSAPLNEWDEARYAQNAFEMNRNHDYINYFYQGQLDLWNAKPPLEVWSIVAASKVFGENAFSLRLSAAVGGALTLLFIYLIGEFYGVGLWCAWLALGTRALIGLHVARTGDMDGLFVGLLAGAIYFFARALRAQARVSDAPRDFVLSGLFFGLSFMQKGFTFFMVLPALFIFFLQSDWRRLWRPFALGLVTLAMLPSSWIFVSTRFGLHATNANLGATNAVGVMIFYDIFARVFGNIDGAHNALNPQEIFRYLDIRFSPLYYAVIVLAIGAVAMRAPSGEGTHRRRKLFWFSGLLTGTILVAVALTRNKHDWYPAPALITMPLLAVAFSELWTKRRAAQILMIGVIAVGVSLRAVEVWRASDPSGIQKFVTSHDLRGKILHFDRQLRQDEQAYVSWAGATAVSDSGAPTAQQESYSIGCSETVCLVK